MADEETERAASSARQRRRPPEVEAAFAEDRLPPLASPYRSSGGHHIPVRPYNTRRSSSSKLHYRRSQQQQQQQQQRYQSPPDDVNKKQDKSNESSLLVFPDNMEEYIGWMSPWAWLWGTIFLSIPAAYVYIGLVLLREFCRAVPAVSAVVQTYLPPVAYVLRGMAAVSWLVEAWCILEALFYVALKIHFYWLNTRDTLEASLSAAPLMDLRSRRVLWQRMMETEAADTAAWIRGWMLDANNTASALADLQQVNVTDISGFVCWSMFEGRRTEHLTTAEAAQLRSFLQEIQERLSLQFYGSMDEDDDDVENSDGHWEDLPAASHDSGYDPFKVPRLVALPTPKKVFSFREDEPHKEQSFFADLYETYRRRYERMRAADFSPVQDLANRLAAPVQHFVHEGLHTAESSGQYVYDTLVPSQVEERLNFVRQATHQVEERLSLVRQATYAQITEAWNSVKNMRERLETARFLSHRRHSLQQQLKGYRVMLHRMLENSHAADIPRQQMAILMRRITECNEALEGLEKRAQSAFVQATGFARKNLAAFLPTVEEPRRFATYSADPLLGIATYPLGFHLFILALTEIPLRAMLYGRGFVKKRIGPVSYYYHPGAAGDSLDDERSFSFDPAPNNSNIDDISDTSSSSSSDHEVIPIVFVHGIGIGLISYMPLIDALLKTGRPLFLPEIPYVSGFRPWQSPNAVLSPQVVTSTLSAMLASHGFLRATFSGHSYGTSWLSYMCKYAEHAVASLQFIDPICFCLHAPRLTKSFVYTRPDPGTISYIIRTDVVVNWTIQRSFPWAWIILFTEQIRVPTTVFLSEKDALVPSVKVDSYLRDHQVPMCDFKPDMKMDHFESKSVVNGCIFRGDGHGGWTERPNGYVPVIAMSAEILCQRASRSRRPDS